MRTLLVPFLLALTACDCGDGSTDPADLSGVDGSVAPDAATDAGSAPDAAPRDAGSDVGPPDASAPDAAADAGPECTFLDDIFIVSCAGGYEYLRRWFATEGDCDDYYTLGSARFPTQEAAMASLSCTPGCVRPASMSVSLIRCGRRSGYIVFRDPEDDCEDAYETPDGIFPSVEAWDEAAPCE